MLSEPSESPELFQKCGCKRKGSAENAERVVVSPVVCNRGASVTSLHFGSSQDLSTVSKKTRCNLYTDKKFARHLAMTGERTKWSFRRPRARLVSMPTRPMTPGTLQGGSPTSLLNSDLRASCQRAPTATTTSNVLWDWCAVEAQVWYTLPVRSIS